MTSNYPFLKDKQALKEIYKHKWIESEKTNTEIGFATAALDWIRNHGNEFLRYQRRIKRESNNPNQNKRF